VTAINPYFLGTQTLYHDILVLSLREFSRHFYSSREDGGIQTPELYYLLEWVLRTCSEHFAQFMDERQRIEGVDRNTTKALQTVVDKVGRFDGRNITKFLRIYTCEMEVHQVSQERIIATFDLAVIPELREMVQELHDGVVLWSRFEELLKDESLKRIRRG